MIHAGRSQWARHIGGLTTALLAALTAFGQAGCGNAAPTSPSPTPAASDTDVLALEVECPGSLRFWAPDGQWYRFSFQPENFSNSDYWKVTCTATRSQGCTTWTITPNGTDGTSVNTLLRIDKDGNILDVGGDYGLTYSFLVER